MSSEELAKDSTQDALQPLRAAVEAAGSSLSLPHVLHKVIMGVGYLEQTPHVHCRTTSSPPKLNGTLLPLLQGAESFVQVVSRHLQGQGLRGALHTLGCSGEGSASASALTDLLSDLQRQEGPQVC